MRFDEMTREQRVEMARRGGRRAHARGTGRRWTTEQAREAALKSASNRASRKQLACMQAALVEIDRANLRCPTTLAAFDGPETA